MDALLDIPTALINPGVALARQISHLDMFFFFVGGAGRTSTSSLSDTLNFEASMLRLKTGREMVILSSHSPLE